MKPFLIAVMFVTASFFSAPTYATPPQSAANTAAPQNSGPTKNPVMTSVRSILTRQQKNIPAAVDAMPADKFSYKPTPDQMSFAHLVIHIAESNNAMCAKLANAPAPKVDELSETDSKDKLLAAVRASFDFCSSSLANADDSNLGDPIEFFGRQGPRAMAAFILTGGWSDHYSAAAMYLRLNGILPPTAQPKK
jgi:hypothetical protein